MTQPYDPRNPGRTKFGNPQAPGAGQNPRQNASQPAASQKKTQAAKGKKSSGAQNSRAPQGKR